MKQKIRDFLTLVKEDRKTKAITGLALLAVLFLFFGPSTKPRRAMARPQPLPQQNVGNSALGSKEAYEDIMLRFDRDVKSITTNVSELTKRVDEQQKNASENEQRTAAILTKMLERINEIGTQPGAGSAPGADPVDISAEDALAEQGEDDLEQVGFDETEPAPPPQPAPQKLAFVARGDSIRVKLLAGVNAPTDGTPYPTLFEATGDVIGPDGSTLPLGGARIIAAAQGSLTDSRALFRITDLSVRLPTGERKVFKADGWIVGEDGIRGMPGVLIDYFDKALAATAVAGTAEGVARGIAAKGIKIQSNGDGIDQVFTGDSGLLALATGAKESTRAFQRLVEQRLSQLTPHVQVYSGREATAVFARDIVVDGLYDALGNSEDTYASLD